MNESWMIREIRKQPETLERLISCEGDNIKGVARTIKKYGPRFIVLAARGSSDNAATYGKYLFEWRNGIPSMLAAPSVFTIYRGRLELKDGVVIGISQSGEATDIVETLARARKNAGLVVAVTNTPNSAITRVADATILLHAGRERALAATKTYTSQLLALMMLSAALREEKEFTQNLYRIPQQINRILSLENEIRQLSERYRYMEHCVIIGRGFNYATVREAALKLMETCYVVAQPFSTADFLHGPIAMMGEGFPVFMCAPRGKMIEPMQKMALDLRKRQVETVVVSSNPKMLSTGSRTVKMPSSHPEIISPLYYIIPFQFFANYCAVAKGINPDNPRYLQKITRTF
ncbi:MAG: SIS domain-containing protein [bacterium]